MRHLLDLPEYDLAAFKPEAGRMRLYGKSGSPPPPDTTVLAASSVETANIGAGLGYAQMNAAQQQFYENKAQMQPIIDAQIATMNQGVAQGNDYFNYMVAKQRPVENKLNDEAMAAGTLAKQEQAAGTAIADARAGTTHQIDQAVRTGARYGMSPAQIASRMGTDMAVGNTQATVAAANGARKQEEALGWAKKLDVAGLYRGLPGASTAAYNSATNAGNSAAGIQQRNSDSLLQGMNMGAGTVMQGRSLMQSGQGQVLNTQTSVYNNAQDSEGEMFGALLGAGTKIAMSDRRLKTDIELVGAHGETALNLYEFAYIQDPSRRFLGVMADEVLEKYPECIAKTANGYMAVNYGRLGIEFKELPNG